MAWLDLVHGMAGAAARIEQEQQQMEQQRTKTHILRFNRLESDSARRSAVEMHAVMMRKTMRLRSQLAADVEEIQRLKALLREDQKEASSDRKALAALTLTLTLHRRQVTKNKPSPKEILSQKKNCILIQ